MLTGGVHDVLVSSAQQKHVPRPPNPLRDVRQYHTISAHEVRVYTILDPTRYTTTIIITVIIH